MGLGRGPGEGKRSDGCAGKRSRDAARIGCSAAGMRIENPRRLCEVHSDVPCKVHFCT